jgi:hypothetical protein
MVCLYVREELWVDFASVQKQTSIREPRVLGYSAENICSYSLTSPAHTVFSSSHYNTKQ